MKSILVSDDYATEEDYKKLKDFIWEEFYFGDSEEEVIKHEKEHNEKYLSRLYKVINIFDLVVFFCLVDNENNYEFATHIILKDKEVCEE